MSLRTHIRSLAQSDASRHIPMSVRLRLERWPIESKQRAIYVMARLVWHKDQK